MHESYKKWLDDGKPKIICQCGCNKEIIIKDYCYWNGIPKYINGHQCIGKPCSEETKEKIRKTKFGEDNPNFGKIGEKSATFGRKHTEEELEIMKKKSTGRKHSQETIKKLSGINNPMFGKHHSEDTKRKISEAEKGKIISNETKKIWSEQRSGENNSNWRGGTSFEPYCEKFNEKKKEEIRKQYERKCYLCNRDEKDNIYKNGKQIKLSVHHIDNDKEQGCNGKQWKLVPLCMHCHNSKKLNI